MWAVSGRGGSSKSVSWGLSRFFFSSRRRHTRYWRDWSSDVCSSDLVYLEGYEMELAQKLVPGVDLWLNNPRRPLEASGTSGMKAALNGIPSLSVLDGWWDEGYNERNGWAIGGRSTSTDEEAQDASDAAELYRLLEEEIVPRFYERDANGLPTAWIRTMRAAIESAIWRFSTARMLGEYVERLYVPASHRTDAEPV